MLNCEFDLCPDEIDMGIDDGIDMGIDDSTSDFQGGIDETDNLTTNDTNPQPMYGDSGISNDLSESGLVDFVDSD